MLAMSRPIDLNNSRLLLLYKLRTNSAWSSDGMVFAAGAKRAPHLLIFLITLYGKIDDA
jgi:hypothetical protein